MNSLLSAAKRFLTSPSKAAALAKERKSLELNAGLYLAFVLGSMLVFWLKPFDFPDANAPLPQEAQGLAFWLKVMLWQPPLEAAWVVALLGLIEWLRKGTLGVKMTLGAAWAAAPVFLIVAHASKDGISRGAFGAGLLVCFGLFAPLLRRAPAEERLPVLSFMLGLNAIGLLMLAAMEGAILVRSSALFQAAQVAGGLWMLGAATLGVRELTGLRLPRAFMAVFLSLIFQMTFAVGLHLVGIVPKDILKALLYA